MGSPERCVTSHSHVSVAIGLSHNRGSCRDLEACASRSCAPYAPGLALVLHRFRFRLPRPSRSAARPPRGSPAWARSSAPAARASTPSCGKHSTGRCVPTRRPMRQTRREPPTQGPAATGRPTVPMSHVAPPSPPSPRAQLSRVVLAGCAALLLGAGPAVAWDLSTQPPRAEARSPWPRPSPWLQAGREMKAAAGGIARIYLPRDRQAPVDTADPTGSAAPPPPPPPSSTVAKSPWPPPRVVRPYSEIR